VPSRTTDHYSSRRPKRAPTPYQVPISIRIETRKPSGHNETVPSPTPDPTPRSIPNPCRPNSHPCTVAMHTQRHVGSKPNRIVHAMTNSRRAPVDCKTLPRRRSLDVKQRTPHWAMRSSAEHLHNRRKRSRSPPLRTLKMLFSFLFFLSRTCGSLCTLPVPNPE
jgi:hypothetical protein